MNSNVNCGLGVVMTYQCGFIIWNKCAPQEGMLIEGEAMHMWVQGIQGISVFV